MYDVLIEQLQHEDETRAAAVAPAPDDDPDEDPFAALGGGEDEP